ncbi:hypothetical protein CHUAL_008126 [Chamberlinius hualienensis]
MFIPRLRQVVIILAFLSIVHIATCCPATNIRGTYRLYHQCTHGAITVTRSTIRALPMVDKFNKYNHIIIETLCSEAFPMSNPEVTKVRFTATKPGNFICINPKGKMVLKSNYVEKMCEFEEIYSASYQYYRLASNRNWLLGFDLKGRPMKKPDYAESDIPDCFHFMKLSVDGSDPIQPASNLPHLGNPPNFNFTKTTPVTASSKKPRRKNLFSRKTKKPKKPIAINAKEASVTVVPQVKSTTHKFRHHRRHRTTRKPSQING